MSDAATATRRHTLTRDAAVRRFGQPAKTWGSVNEPRYRQADGLEFNEMWVFKSPRDLAPEWSERVLYWYRYDLVASVRVNRDGRREREELTP